MAVCGVTQCDFVVFTNKGIHIVTVDFDENFWKSTIDKVKKFYTQKIIKTLLLELWVFKSKALAQSQVLQAIVGSDTMQELLIKVIQLSERYETKTFFDILGECPLVTLYFWSYSCI